MAAHQVAVGGEREGLGVVEEVEVGAQPGERLLHLRVDPELEQSHGALALGDRVGERLARRQRLPGQALAQVHEREPLAAREHVHQLLVADPVGLDAHRAGDHPGHAARGLLLVGELHRGVGDDQVGAVLVEQALDALVVLDAAVDELHGDPVVEV